MIDRQHQHIITLVNSLEAAAGGEGASTADVVLDHVCRYIGMHFRDEERLMADAGYPGFAEHEAEHAACAATLTRMVSSVASGERDLLAYAVPLLRNLLWEHMAGADQRYSDWSRTHIRVSEAS